MREEDESNIRGGWTDMDLYEKPSAASAGYGPSYPSAMPDDVKRYAEWFKAAYGWNPFEPVKCFHCGEPVALIEVYRCYECRMPMHRDCCVEHCKGHRP